MFHIQLIYSSKCYVCSFAAFGNLWAPDNVYTVGREFFTVETFCRCMIAGINYSWIKFSRKKSNCPVVRMEDCETECCFRVYHRIWVAVPLSVSSAPLLLAGLPTVTHASLLIRPLLGPLTSGYETRPAV